MSLTPAELAKRDDFAAQYRQTEAPAVRAVERAVCGCDYGGTSWATRAEADQIAAALNLAPGVAMLEIGAGAGWPSVYMARQSGCDVALVDLPLDGLLIAVRRAEQEELPGTCLAAVADAAHLPFPDASFDAINHSDVLCCLVQKREVLAECLRVLRPGGRMAFSVIYIAEGLSPGDHARAAETAPEFAESDTSYPDLLAQTGWAIRERHDLTAEFRENCIRKIEAETEGRSALEPLMSGDFDERQARMQRRISVLEQGHMRRGIFIVEPAG
jgi:ubiquinone/menaquinone biosynthesis C-methylase UbiE